MDLMHCCKFLWSSTKEFLNGDESDESLSIIAAIELVKRQLPDTLRIQIKLIKWDKETTQDHAVGLS